MNQYILAFLVAASLVPLAVNAESYAELDKTELDYLTSLYKELHANPELSFFEKKTAAQMVEQLKKIDSEASEITIESGVGGYGVVAKIKNGEGPTLLLRADMDALPVAEKTGLSYASKVSVLNDKGLQLPVMHACGHDIHMSVLVGTMRHLMKNKKDWQGTLILVFQPAEERGAGARAMLEDGLHQRFGRPDYNLALHVSAELPAGMVGYTSEYAMANVDTVDILVRGIGGHGAYPHKTKDPIVLASMLILELQTIVSREVSPLEPAVVTVGSIHGGTKHNIIGDQVKLQMTVRSYSDETRNLLLTRISQMAEGIARTAGLPEALWPVVKHKDNFTPSVYNDPALMKVIANQLERTLGENNVRTVKPVMAGEDFARYGRVEPRIPSALLWLGAVAPEQISAAAKEGDTLPGLHSAEFAPVPDATIKTGVKTMTAIVNNLLNSNLSKNNQDN